MLQNKIQQKAKKGHRNIVLTRKKLLSPIKAFVVSEPLEVLAFLQGWAEFNHSYTTPNIARAIPGCCIDLLLKGG